MKQGKYIETNFINFLIEKYKRNDDELNGDENKEKTQELEENEEDKEKSEEEVIDDLIEEYNKMMKKYEDYRIFNRK